MQKQMCWLSKSGESGHKILYLRTNPNELWRPYTAFPQYAARDYLEPLGSKGWATYQKLRKLGWVLIPSAGQKVVTEPEKSYALTNS